MAENYRTAAEALPRHMRQIVIDWIEYGRPHASEMDPFLRALLLNNLVEAFAYADDANGRAMKAWAGYLYLYMPTSAWRTEERLAAWAKIGGLVGMGVEIQRSGAV